MNNVKDTLAAMLVILDMFVITRIANKSASC